MGEHAGARLVAGSRRRNLPAPPRFVAEALLDPDRDPVRPWLLLLPDEAPPRILTHRAPWLVVWSSLWPARPSAVLRFDLVPAGGGTDLRWTLIVDEPLPDAPALGHLRKRVNLLINGNLRLTFGH